jgi:hypothetical protein
VTIGDSNHIQVGARKPRRAHAASAPPALRRAPRLAGLDSCQIGSGCVLEPLCPPPPPPSPSPPHPSPAPAPPTKRMQLIVPRLCPLRPSADRAGRARSECPAELRGAQRGARERVPGVNLNPLRVFLRTTSIQPISSLRAFPRS